MTDSASDETSSGASESTFSSYELDNSYSDDNDSLIVELDRKLIDNWEWPVDSAYFATCYNYFDGRGLESNIIQLIDSFSKLICLYQI